ncbi:sensor signal transduction histidine kinase [Gottschalkia purinilytica]|uniref:histidine kinase n=1 Tax=Gottschalkia purinilytica TaxID=1503 RepID=A0A0L0WDP6_GOTPU|nr:sensor histidine kinase [Gottschalkia purinilytica]KNF09599.1 sensor signal transduction histidine kinase [Gottschalkia purinilytica]
MNFIKYLKDRISYFLIYFISIGLTIFIISLDLIIREEKLSTDNILYTLILSTILLIVFIVIDYSKKHGFYKGLNMALEENENSNEIFKLPKDNSIEHELFKKLLIKNYDSYENKLEKYRENYKDYTYFKSRWIHQMKTPVSVIKLMLENEEDRNIDETARRNYASMKEEIEKLSHGLEMALYTLRVNDFEQDFKVERVNILEVVRNIINESKNTFIMNSIYPKIDVKEDIEVKTDKKWIKFVIRQIISNSIKYSKVKESENKSVLVTVNTDAEKTILSIKDKGVGIPKQDLGKVFDPFFTGRNGRIYSESTGVGMYLAKTICNKLGHDISVKSEEGEWTEITIVFYKGRSLYDIV